MTVAFLSHSDCGRHDTGWGHPEHVGRIRAIPRALREDPELMGALVHAEGRHANEDELALAHDPAYVRAVKNILHHYPVKKRVVRGLAHITGEGLPGNIPRVLPAGRRVVLDGLLHVAGGGRAGEVDIPGAVLVASTA